MSFSKRQLIFGILVITIYLSFLLDRAPRVSTNEPWESIPAYQLAFKGTLNNPVLSGLEFLDQHFLGPQVIQPIILGAFYRIFGLTLFNGRLVSLIMALGTLWILFRLFEFERLEKFFIATGLILLASDNFFYYYARFIRAEIFVTFFGLLSFYFLYKAIVTKRTAMFMPAGFFTGVCALSHPAASIMAVSLYIILIYEYRLTVFRSTQFWIFAVFTSLALLPFLVYLFYQDWSNGFSHFWAQMAKHATQSSDGFWIHTFLAEWERYRKYALFPYRIPIVISQLIFLIYAFRIKDRLARFSLIVVLSHMILLTFLITTRNPRYFLPALPFLSIVILKTIRHLRLDSVKSFFTGYSSKSLHQKIGAVSFVILMGIQIPGNPGLMMAERSANYDDLIKTLRSEIPAGCRVVGPMTFWLGFSDCTYRTEETYEFANVDSCLHDLKPDYVITHTMYLWKRDKVKWSSIAETIDRFVKNNYRVIKKIDNKTYGPIMIWKSQQK